MTCSCMRGSASKSLYAVSSAVAVVPEFWMSGVRGLEKGVWCVKMRLNGIKLRYLRKPKPTFCVGLGSPSFVAASCMIGINLLAAAWTYHG